jgi:hypothetical protein
MWLFNWFLRLGAAPSNRRQNERRVGGERRGVLRWDPRAKERRSGTDRRSVRGR